MDWIADTQIQFHKQPAIKNFVPKILIKYPIHYYVKIYRCSMYRVHILTEEAVDLLFNN